MGTIYYKQEENGLKAHGIMSLFLPLGSPRPTLRKQAIRAGLIAALFCRVTKSPWTNKENNCLLGSVKHNSIPPSWEQASEGWYAFCLLV